MLCFAWLTQYEVIALMVLAVIAIIWDFILFFLQWKSNIFPILVRGYNWNASVEVFIIIWFASHEKQPATKNQQHVKLMNLFRNRSHFSIISSIDNNHFHRLPLNSQLRTYTNVQYTAAAELLHNKFLMTRCLRY